MGGGGVAQFVEVPAGVALEEDAGAVVAESGAASGGEVEVFDVEGEDLVGAGGGLVEQSPQGFLPQ